jgi:hypothetical protein
VWRTLRAFAWMRWRVLLNSLERTGARDTLERLSLAVEQIGPIIAFLLLVPSALGIAALSAYAGYWLASSETVLTFEALRMLLLVATGFSLVGPVLMPSLNPTAVVRLLLLPIARTTLYVGQSAAAISEPWILLSLPIVIFVAAGLAAGGAVAAAVLSLVAGVLTIVCLVGVSTLATLLLHLLVRDRRRGELLALFFIVLVPALALLPSLLLNAPETRATDGGRRDAQPPVWVTRGIAVGGTVAPSELFARATRAASQGRMAQAAVPLATLTGLGVTLHALGLLAFGRVVSSPGTSRRRSVTPGRWSDVRVPLLSRGAAAVAGAQVRLAMRTPRGRSILLSPFIVFVLFALVMRRRGEMELGFLNLVNGLSLATFGSAVCLLAVLPFALNQFAIDRAGLTLALLAPLPTRDLLAGKAVGNGLIAVGPAAIVILVAFVLFPDHRLALWLTLPLGLCATYLLAAPGAAALSAIFPRTVDLNSIGRSSNAHGLASLLGLALVAAAALPAVALAAVIHGVLHRPTLAPIAMLAWCAIAAVLSRVLFVAVAALFERRKENLGLVN